MFSTHLISFTLFKFKTMKITKQFNDWAGNAYTFMFYKESINKWSFNYNDRKNGKITFGTEAFSIRINDEENNFIINTDGTTGKDLPENTKVILKTEADLEFAIDTIGHLYWDNYFNIPEIQKDVEKAIETILLLRKAELKSLVVL